MDRNPGGGGLWPVAIVVGLTSEWAAFGWHDFSHWIPDLVVGLVFIGCGVTAIARNRGTAALLIGAGLSWFLANFWADLVFVHRGLLVICSSPTQAGVAAPGSRSLPL